MWERPPSFCAEQAEKGECEPERVTVSFHERRCLKSRIVGCQLQAGLRACIFASPSLPGRLLNRWLVEQGQMDENRREGYKRLGFASLLLQKQVIPAAGRQW